MGNCLRLTLCTAFGLGLSPVAPGTCGALLGVLIHLATAYFLPPSVQTIALVVCLIGVVALNHVLTPWATWYWDSEDPSHFVLDEVAGYLMVPIFFSAGHLWQVAVWGFLLFRVFDIIKVPPARQIDRCMAGSWGIVLDDLVSGLYAALGLYLLKEIGLWTGLTPWLIDPAARWAGG